VHSAINFGQTHSIMLKNSKVFTVLVAYNAITQDLNHAIKEWLKETSFIVICNNSKEDLIYHDLRIKVLNFEENLGIAKAQSLGMAWAFANNADFILQVDQDSLPDPGMVKLLLESFLKLKIMGYNIGLIGPRAYDKFKKKPQGNKSNLAFFHKGKIVADLEGIDFVDSMISSGSLIPKKAFQKNGAMLDELFIDHVDLEYCWRLKANGFLIARNNKAMLAHRIGDGRLSFLGIFNVAVSAPIRQYYWVRNFLYLFNRNYVPMYWKLINFHKIIFRILFYPFFLNNGFERLKFMLLGLKDGFRGKMYRIDSIK